MGYGVGLYDHDRRLIAFSVGAWAAIYLVSVPLVARRVALRSPPGDSMRAAAILGIGALPWAFYIPLWSQLTTPRALLVGYPVMLLWCSAAYFLALWDKSPTLSPAGRTLVLAGGALIYGAIALISLGGAAFTFVLLLPGLPPPDILIGCLGLITVGGLLGALSAWAALRMWLAKDAPPA